MSRSKASAAKDPDALARGFVQIAANAGAGEQTRSELQSAVAALGRVEGRKNWSELDRVDGVLHRIESRESAAVARLIRGLRLSFTSDRTWRFLLLYTVFLVLLTPVASYLLSLLLGLGALAGTKLFQAAEFRDIVKGIVSAALYLPLLLVNKNTKTARCPVVRPSLLPILLILSLLVTVEFLLGVFFFQDPSSFSIGAFLEHLRVGASTQWLFPLPFVVVAANILTASRFLVFSKEAAEFLSSELGTYMRFVVVAIVSLAISGVLRLGLAVSGSDESIGARSSQGQMDATAERGARQIVVATARLNLRICPEAPRCRILRTLKVGSRLHVLEKKGGWLRVDTLADTGLEGWVSESYTESSADLQ